MVGDVSHQGNSDDSLRIGMCCIFGNSDNRCGW